MQETSPGPDGTITCNSADGTNNAATCSTINKYGGKTAMAPGEQSAVTITLKNTGSVNATAATLAPGTCVSTPAPSPENGKSNLCDRMHVVITQGGQPLAEGTPNELAARKSITLTAPAAGASVTYQITTTLPAGVDNSFSGTALSQPLTWTYTA